MSSFDEHDDLRDLRDLPREAQPPVELEERVVAALRERSLIEAAPQPLSSRSRWALAAALLIAAFGGWMAREVTIAKAPPRIDGREYLVLLAEPNGLETTKSLAELVGEYREWATNIGAQGSLVMARRLVDGGRRLSTDEAGAIEVSPEGPWMEATGFFLIRAQSVDEATDLVVEDSPHLAYGGEISLRGTTSEQPAIYPAPTQDAQSGCPAWPRGSPARTPSRS